VATSAESTFIRAVAAAESTRQVAKASAFATWNYGTGSALSTYTAALEAADNAYIASVNSALSTLGGFGVSVPFQGAQTGVVVGGGLGLTGPIGSNISELGGQV
jgi:hypothetical protein